MAPLTVTIPRLTTPRLLLRELRISDFDAFAENSADPEATRFLGGAVERRMSWRVFASAAGCWMLQGAGWWAVESRETGSMVGTVGAFLREGYPDFEIGWTLFRRFWGQGFAIESARAALAFSFEQHDAKRVIAHIAHENAPSIAVSQKLGMVFEGEVDFYGERIGRYAIAR